MKFKVTVSTSNWRACALSAQVVEGGNYLAQSPGTPLMNEQPYSPHLSINSEVLSDCSDQVEDSEVEVSRMKLCEETEPEKVNGECLNSLKEIPNVQEKEMANIECIESIPSENALEARSFTPALTTLNRVHSNISPNEENEYCKSEESVTNLIPSGSALEINSENLSHERSNGGVVTLDSSSSNIVCEVGKVSLETAILVPESSTYKPTDTQSVSKIKSSVEESNIRDAKTNEFDSKTESNSSRSAKVGEPSNFRNSHHHHSSSSRTNSSHRSSKDKSGHERYKRDIKSDSADNNSEHKRSSTVGREERKDHSRGSSSSDRKQVLWALYMKK